MDSMKVSMRAHSPYTGELWTLISGSSRVDRLTSADLFGMFAVAWMMYDAAAALRLRVQSERSHVNFAESFVASWVCVEHVVCYRKCRAFCERRTKHNMRTALTNTDNHSCGRHAANYNLPFILIIYIFGDINQNTHCPQRNDDDDDDDDAA